MSSAARLAYGLSLPKPVSVHHTRPGWSAASCAYSTPSAANEAGSPDSTTTSAPAISRRSTSGACSCFRSSVIERLPR